MSFFLIYYYCYYYFMVLSIAQNCCGQNVLEAHGIRELFVADSGGTKELVVDSEFG